MYTEMEGESKYHVANILSSMANGGHAVQVTTVRINIVLDVFSFRILVLQITY